MKKKILILTSTFPRWKNDSTPPFVFYLARHLEKHFQVFVLAPHFPGARDKNKFGQIIVYRFHYFWEKFEKLCYEGGGFSKIRRNFWLILLTPFYFLTALLATYKLVRGKKIDLINAHWAIPQGFIAVLVKKLTGVPVVITCHGTDILGYNNYFLRLLKIYSLKNADLILPVSNKLKIAILKMIPQLQKKTRVRSMGIDIEFFRQSAIKDRNLIKKKFAYNRKLVLFVGRLVKKKGINYLIEAMVQVKKSFPSVLLLILGEGPSEDDLKKQIERVHLENNVSFLGWIDNQKLAGYYGAADVFVSSPEESNWGSEGFGLTFIEAMASGTAVIGTRVGAVGEIIKDGQNGLLVPQRDSTKLAGAILKVLKSLSLRNKFQKNCQTFIEQKFDWKVVEKEYQENITRIISNVEINAL